YADLAPSVDLARVRAVLADAYRGERFVHLLPEGAWPDTAHVQGSNEIHLGAVVDAARGKAVLLCALDNLVKGAAGAAVQSMNVLFGRPEAEGLEAAPLFP